jgi:hypothetical protein
MTSHACSNCGSEFLIDQLDSVAIVQGIESDQGADGVQPMSIDIAALCPDCVEGAKTIKLVLKRNNAGQFAYEQFSVLEMANRAFGTS